MYYNSGSFWNQIPQVTKNLIIVNVLMFLATLVNENFMVGTFAMFYPTSPFFRGWQPLTHMFMHGGIWHIFFNMYALLMFGSVLERALGTKRFLLFYFICGFGAAALHMGVQYLQVHHWLAQGEMNNYYNLIRTPMLGASGAIYGILIGFALLNPDAVLVLLFPPIPLKAKWWVIIFAVIELGTGITGTRIGIAHFAHLGGMLFGFLLMWLWKKQGRIWW